MTVKGKITKTELDEELSKQIEDNTLMTKEIKDKQEEVFQSVSNGKKSIANAITDKGIRTLASDPFNTMANNISKIKTGYSSGDKIDADKVDIEYEYIATNSFVKDKEITFPRSPGHIELYNDTDFLYSAVPYGSDYFLYKYTDSSGFPKDELYYRFYLSKLFFSIEYQEVYYVGIQLNGGQSLKGFRLGTAYSSGTKQIETYDDQYYYHYLDTFNDNSVFFDNDYIYIPYIHATESRSGGKRNKSKRMVIFNKNCSYVKTVNGVSSYLMEGMSCVKDGIIYTIINTGSRCYLSKSDIDGSYISDASFNNINLIPEHYSINFIYFLDKDHILLSKTNGVLRHVNLIDETSETISILSGDGYNNVPRIYTDDNTIHAVVDGNKCIYSIKYENGKYSFPLISKMSLMNSPKSSYSITKDSILYPLGDGNACYQVRGKEKVIKNIIIK